MDRRRPTPIEAVTLLPALQRPTLVRPVASGRNRLFAGWGPRI